MLIAKEALTPSKVHNLASFLVENC